MKKMLNTVYVVTEGASLKKDGENLVAMLDGAEIARSPLHMLGSIVVFGPILISPGLIGACTAKGITIALLDRAGRFHARIEGPVSGNVLLRRAQYRFSERPEIFARGFLIGKIANQRTVLQRALRDGEQMSDEARAKVSEAVQGLAYLLRRVATGLSDLESLRGMEGAAANYYFGVFNALIRSDDRRLQFHGRSRRPPLDAVNALLSFLYTLLTHECSSACEAVGLDPAVGFLHRERPGRPSLALDLMEELRPPFVDRLALALLNRKQIQSHHFEWRDGGAVFLNEKGRKIVLTALQERKKVERRHDFINEISPIGLIPYIQALLLSRYIRGDLDAYPPWFWK